MFSEEAGWQLRVPNWPATTPGLNVEQYAAVPSVTAWWLNSFPAAVDSLLKQQAGDSGTATSVQMEARYLLSLMKGERPEIANTQTIRASLEEVTTASATDVELLNAIESVCLFHHYVSPAAERADGLLNTPEAWYRRAKAASDDYHRIHALRRTLALDRDYVPAVIEMARRYWAQSQLTRARTLLLSTLERRPAETSIRALLVEFDINEGYASKAVASMNQLRSDS